MQRYRTYGAGDDVTEIFGDMQLDRLDMKSDPAMLPAGTAQAIENMRFDTNGTTVRGGISRQFEAGTSIGEILCAGVYSPDGSEDKLVLLTHNTFWIFTPDTRQMEAFAYPDGEIILAGGDLDMVQAGIGAVSTLPKVYIARGLQDNVLVFDGTRVEVDALVPKNRFGMYYQNRLAAATGLQEIGVSDFLDYTKWNYLNQFQIARGGADYIMGMRAYQKDYVLIGCRKHIYLAYFDPTVGTGGYSGALSNASWLRLLTAEAGLISREGWIEAAGLIWFITDNGIYAFQPQLDNSLTVLGRPLSADIQPVFSRMSTGFASRAVIQRNGYRLYFAMPISDEPVAVASLALVNTLTTGVDLPVDLPVSLAAGGIATLTLAGAHALTPGDTVQLANIAGGGLNGEHTVVAVVNEVTFSVAVDDVSAVILGTRSTCQRLATRNNVIAVFNLNNRSADHPLGCWESIDTLPSGFYADWLKLADFGAQRRLWLVDADRGPGLYEEGDVDEVGDILGGVNLPVDLPVDLETADFASTPIRGRILTRAYRWGGAGFAYGRRVRSVEARLALADEDAGTLTLRVRTPDRMEHVQAVAFAAGSQADVAARLRPNLRGLEAELELVNTSGRPTIRALEVQVMRSGSE